MPTLAESHLTQAHHRQQLVVRRAALREMLVLWPGWTLDDEINTSWDRFMIGALAVAEKYHALSSARSGAYHSSLRLMAGATGNFVPPLAMFDRDRAIAGFMLLGLIQTKKALANNRPNPKDKALVRVTAAMTAAVLSGGRDTLEKAIEDDPAVVGFVRQITGTCDFCRGLAAKGVNVGSFEAHSNCACVPSPAFEEGAAHFVDREQQAFIREDEGWAEDNRILAQELGYKTPASMNADITKNWQKWLDDASVNIQVPDGDVLHSILADGRFKSQFESKTSMGFYDHAGRSSMEKKLFGYADDVPAAQRPIYGYASNTPLSPVFDVEAYGDIKVVLKPQAKKRATVTMVDSFDTRIAASPVDDVSITSFNMGEYSAASKKSLVNPGRSTQSPSGYGYVEVQYHGGVVVDDIAKVFFENQNFDAIEQSLLTALDEAGIPWQFRDLPVGVAP